MSIVPLKRATLVGLLEEKERVLGELQEFGCLHLIPFSNDVVGSNVASGSGELQEALRFLLACPQPWRQATLDEDFDPARVGARAIEIKKRLLELEDDKDALIEQIDLLLPFGDFEFPGETDLGGLRLWLYDVPDAQITKIADSALTWSQVAHRNRSAYVAVLSEVRPEGMPVEPLDVGSTSLAGLERQLERTEMEIEDLRAERGALSRWISLYMRNLDRMEDRAALDHASRISRESDVLFAVQGWVPEDRVGELGAHAERNHLVLEVEDPGPDETPPVEMENPEALSFGERLLAFYQLPGYRDWDPSSVVFISFAVFFAMILADAGYGLVLGIGLLLFWKRLKTTDSARGFRRLMSWIVVGSIAFGVALGSYFGVSPDAESWLGSLKIMDINDFGTMMQLSILVGGGHMILAKARTAWHRRSGAGALAPLGWAAIVAGGLTAYVGLGTRVVDVGAALLGVGAFLVLVFSGRRPVAGIRGVVNRLADGLQGLAGFSGMFGDVLSYLRLFALGLASASLALTFNGLAAQVADAGNRQGIALVFGLVVLVLGHVLNLALGLISGVVHGLRLNLIEFYKWSVFDEGRAYQPFRKKESVTWIP